MTIKLLILVIGSGLLYAGWKNLSVRALLFGDNTQVKTPVTQSGTGKVTQ